MCERAYSNVAPGQAPFIGTMLGLERKTRVAQTGPPWRELATPSAALPPAAGRQDRPLLGKHRAIAAEMGPNC